MMIYLQESNVLLKGFGYLRTNESVKITSTAI